MLDFQILDACEMDVSDIAYIETECFSKPWSKNSFINAFSHTPWHFFVAKRGKECIGYGGVYMILDEGQISNIAVLPSMRGNGVGKAILEKIIDFCKQQNAIKITLEVRKSNIVAKNLYLSCGFNIVGERPNYYFDPIEDAFLMDKDI